MSHKEAQGAGQLHRDVSRCKRAAGGAAAWLGLPLPLPRLLQGPATPTGSVKQRLQSTDISGYMYPLYLDHLSFFGLGFLDCQRYGATHSTRHCNMQKQTPLFCYAAPPQLRAVQRRCYVYNGKQSAASCSIQCLGVCYCCRACRDLQADVHQGHATTRHALSLNFLLCTI